MEEIDIALENAQKEKAVKSDHSTKVPVHLWRRFLLKRVFFMRERIRRVWKRKKEGC